MLTKVKEEEEEEKEQNEAQGETALEMRLGKKHELSWKRSMVPSRLRTGSKITWSSSFAGALNTYVMSVNATGCCADASTADGLLREAWGSRNMLAALKRLAQRVHDAPKPKKMEPEGQPVMQTNVTLP